MCEFCAQHGDGKKWYLQAENYAFDLSRDLERSEYIIDFVRNFDTHLSRNVPLLEAVKQAPKPVRKIFRAVTHPRQLRDHYGQPVPIEECERIFDIASSIVQMPCVCRHFSKKPEEGFCIGMTVNPIDDTLDRAFAAFNDGPDVPALQHLTREQASALLKKAERMGLMHSVWTFKTPFIAAICNCKLEDGCMAMRTTLEFDYPTMFKGEYRAAVTDELCTGCGACVARCPFSALTLDERGIASVDAEACYGCGICRSACPREAIALEDRVVAAPA